MTADRPPLDMTPEEFLREVAAFRRFITSRLWWALAQPHRDGAVDGLTFAYLHTTPTPQWDQDRLYTLWHGSLQEYKRREEYLLPSLV